MLTSLNSLVKLWLRLPDEPQHLATPREFVCTCGGIETTFVTDEYIVYGGPGDTHAWTSCPWFDAAGRTKGQPGYNAHNPQQHVALLDEYGEAA